MIKISKFKSYILSASLFVFAMLPFLAFAQTDKCSEVGTNTIMYIVCRIALLINTIIPILISLAVLVFIVGVIQYVIADEEEAKKKGRNTMIYGLIGLLVIVSVWGLVGLLRNTFGIGLNAPIAVPCVPSPGNECP